MEVLKGLGLQEQKYITSARKDGNALLGGSSCNCAVLLHAILRGNERNRKSEVAFRLEKSDISLLMSLVSMLMERCGAAKGRAGYRRRLTAIRDKLLIAEGATFTLSDCEGQSGSSQAGCSGYSSPPSDRDLP